MLSAKTRYPEFWRYIAVTASLLAYSYPFLTVLTLRLDEGWCLTDAVRVYHGQVPFLDFFEIVGPYTFYWIALFFKIFGETWLATRACVLVTGAATALLLYFLARHIKRGTETPVLVFWLAVVFPTWPAVNHHLVANLFTLAAFSLLVWWIDRGPTIALVLCGFAIGITIMTLMHQGLLLFGALIVIVFVNRTERSKMRALVCLSIGALLTLAIFVSYFWWKGALSSMIFANVVWPLKNYSEVGATPYGFGSALPFTRVSDALSPVAPSIVCVLVASFLSIPSLLILFLPFLVASLGICFRRTSFTAKTNPYWIAGSALWVSQAHRPDMVHLILASPIFIVLLFSFLNGRLARVCQFITASSVLLATVNAMLCLLATERLSTPVGTVRAFARNPILAFTNSHIVPGQSIFIYPYAPIYYFLSRGNNPTKFSYLLYRHQTPEQMRDAINSLDKDQTEYVIWDTAFDTKVAPSILPGYLPPPERNKIIEHYLNDRYTEIDRKDGIGFFARKTGKEFPDRSATQ